MSRTRGKSLIQQSQPLSVENAHFDEDVSPSLIEVRERFKPQGPGLDVMDAHMLNMQDSEQQTGLKCESVIRDQELVYCCDMLKGLTEDIYDGFDEELFESCKEFLYHFEAEAKKSEELRSRLKADLAASKQAVGESFTHKMLVFMEFPDSGRWAFAFYVFMSLVVIASCVIIVVETLPAYNPIVFPNYREVWQACDWALTVIMTLETGCRFCVHIFDDSMPSSRSQNALRFLRRPSNVADIVSLLPTYLGNAFGAGRIVVGTLRTLRILRILKFLRRFQPIRMVLKAMKSAAYALIAPTMFLALCLLLFSSTIFFAERGQYDPNLMLFTVPDFDCESQPKHFLPVQVRYPAYNASRDGLEVANMTCPRIPSKFITILQTVWWGVATMPTTGYGDLVPKTVFGQTVGFMTIVFGLIFLAMPIAVIGTNFMLVLTQEENEKSKRKQEEVMKQDFYFQAMQRQRNAYRCKQPGEELLTKLQELTRLNVLDLTNPSDDVLFVCDSLLQKAVQQFANGLAELSGDDPVFDKASSVPLWTATTTTSPAYEVTGAEISSDAIIEKQTLTRPVQMVIGSGCGSPTDPDVVIFNPAQAHALVNFRELLQQQVRHRREEEDLLPFKYYHQQELTMPPNATWSNLSQRMGVLTVMRVWDENIVLLRACPGTHVTVYRPAHRGFQSQLGGGGSPLLPRGKEKGVSVHRLTGNVRRFTSECPLPPFAPKTIDIQQAQAEAEAASKGDIDDVEGRTTMRRLDEREVHNIHAVYERIDKSVNSETEYFQLEDGDIVQFGGRPEADHSSLISGRLRTEICRQRDEYRAQEEAADEAAMGDDITMRRNSLSRGLPGMGSGGMGGDEADKYADVPSVEELLVATAMDCVFYRYSESSSVI